jgi:PAS domain S-box-containing protein
MNAIDQTKNRRILIIDDNESIHGDFDKLLGKSGHRDSGLDELMLAVLGENEETVTEAGYELTSAFQGQEGFELVKQAVSSGAPYALAFVDIRMPPGWDGIKTIKHIWEVDPNLEIVICTAYSDYGWEDIQKKLGNSNQLMILKKPFDSIEVRQIASALTEKWNYARQARLTLDELNSKVEERTRELRGANDLLTVEIGERRRAQEETAAAHEYLKTLMDSVHAGIVCIDAETYEIVDVNKFAASMIGIPKEGITGRVCHQFICPAAEGKCPITDLGNQVDLSERTLVCADGSEMDILKSVVPIMRDGRQFLIESFVSIKSLKAAEDALRDSEARLNAMFQSITDPMSMVDRDLRVVWCNESARKLFGENLVGRNCSEVYPNHKELSCSREYLAREAFKDGQSHSCDMETIGLDGICRCFHCTAHVALRDAGGEPATAMIIDRDVTAQRESENAILKAHENQSHLNTILRISLEDTPLEEILKQVLDAFSMSSWLPVLPKGAIFLVEDQPDVLVLKVTHNLPESLHTLCARVPFGHCLCGIAAETREPVYSACVDDRHEIRCEGMAPHGHYIVPILDGDAVLGVIDLYLEEGHTRDDQEIAFLESVAQTLAGMIRRKQFEKALRHGNDSLIELNQLLQKNQNLLVQSEKMASLGLLAAGVAHEINNPLGFVMSNMVTLGDYIEVFKSLFDLDKELYAALAANDLEKARKTLSEINDLHAQENFSYILGDIGELLSESHDGTERIRDIVQNLKSFARLDEAEIKEADINDCIESTLKVIWNELKYKCTVHKDMKPLPLLRCYPQQLNQVFMNLLINAAQAISGQGDIAISTEASDRDIVVRFSDTGSGIPAENIPKLFDPFFTTKPVGKGTGLGLSISHGIIEKHHGTIAVESTLGKGTVFTIRLPLEGIDDQKPAN